jgi:molybdenum cofactor guanylyltransferase
MPEAMLSGSLTSATACGVVLTGGASKRFGSPKALVEVEGVPMALRVASALSGARCHPVVAVGSIEGLSEVWAGEFGRGCGSSGLIWPDRWPGEGPLGGVITALSASGDNVVTAACDLAWLDAASVTSILEVASDAGSMQAIYGSRSGRLVPVIWWNTASLPILEAAFADGLRSLHGALALLRTSMVEFSAAAAHGANSPSDLV